MSIFAKRQARGKRSMVRLRPRLEWLEGRVVLSTFHVNTTLDTVAVNLKTGTDASGHVSLRSAIMAADAKGGSNKIILPAGDFTLTIPAASGDGNASGDLDIDANVSIQGRGATQTIIDGNNLDRVIAVDGGNVTITGVTIQHGRVVGDGGGILNDGGRLSLSSVVVANNVAVGTVGSAGTIFIGFGGSINGGAGGEARGGGIFNEAGSLSLTKTTVTSNQAIGGAGGNGAAGIGIAAPSGGTGAPGDQGAGGDGGSGGAGGAGLGAGIFNAAGATLTLNGDTISANQAHGGIGGNGGGGGVGTGGAGGGSGSSTIDGFSGAGGQGIGGIGAQAAQAAPVRVAACSTLAALP